MKRDRMREAILVCFLLVGTSFFNLDIVANGATIHDLTVTVIGEHGTVEPNSGPYPEGTVVTLTATPEKGYVVRQWSGTDDDDSCANTHTVTMDSDKTVTVEFRQPRIFHVPGEYNAIQEAIDAAGCGDIVVLNAGVHSGDINFRGKNIIVSSMNPDDPCSVATTIIQGSGAGPVVTFSGSESESSRLDGITITGGNTTGDGGGICGNGTEATILNCVIRNNHADGNGGGVSDCDGTLVRCTITGNTAGSVGGGICVIYSNVSVEDCDINYNNAAVDGGGIFVWGSPILIENCRISRNSAMHGGGVYLAGDIDPASGGVPQVRQCLITENTAGEQGGGISCEWYAEPLISNCTIAGNAVADGHGGGLCCSYDSYVEVINSIIWGNSAGQGFQVAVGGGDRWVSRASMLALSYSDVEGGPGNAYIEEGSILDWGIGAIDSDPQLVDPDGGNWRLGAGSPCIDAGDNTAIPLSLVKDLDGNARITNQVVDLGPYESMYYYVDGVNGDDTNDGTSPETAFASIQKGIDEAHDRYTIVVWPGIYAERINFKRKAITVRSIDYPAVIEAPSQDAVSFHLGEGYDSVLQNFVIRGSSIAVACNNESSPTLKNLTIVDNDLGIMAYENSDPDITNCILWNNSSSDLFQCEAKYSLVEENSGTVPRFADLPGGDYHLLSEQGRYVPAYGLWSFDDETSPGVDGGDPSDDPSGERMPNGGRINIGAYGGTAYATMSEWPLAHDKNKDGRTSFKDLASFCDEWLRELPWAGGG